MMLILYIILILVALLIGFILSAITGRILDEYRIRKNPQKYTKEYFIQNTKNISSNEALIFTLVYTSIVSVK